MKKDIRKGYAEQRRRAYPSIADQLDKIYHEGLESWQAEISAIKKKFPKQSHKLKDR